VQYRPTTGGAWKTASASGSNGQKDFTATLTGLEPGKTYEYQLVTNSGYVRERGQFTAGGSSSAGGSNNSALPQSSGAAQESAEKAVQITSGPTVTADSTGQNATITWTTNNVASNQVQYRPTSGGSWKNAYDKQGSKNHSLQLTGLTPSQTYEYKILTRDGDVRTSGQFTATPGATASASANPAGAPGATGSSTSSGTKVPLNRGVNSSTGAHAYSTSSLPSGFNQEGVAGYVMSSQVDGTTPLYGLVSPTGEYFLTADTNERNSFMSSGGRDAGTMGYIATSQQSGTLPLHRLVNSKKQHLYTADPNEHARLLTQGWRDEGVTGYVWQQ
jgi:hypothetical protein